MSLVERVSLPAVMTLISLTVGSAVGQSAPTAKKPDMTAQELIQLTSEIEREVEAIRGMKFKHPVKTDVRTEKELRAFIEKELFEEQLGQGKLQQNEAFLRMTGLIPRDCDMRKTILDVLLNQVGGYYDPKTKAFYMLKREGVGYGPLLNRTLIAHELTHALDDQHFDLARLMKAAEASEDAALAIGAVVEGSATHLMTVYMTQAVASGKYSMDEVAAVAAEEMKRSGPFLAAPRYFTTLAANYTLGLLFVMGADAGGLAGINEASAEKIQKHMRQLIAEPPQSSEQIIHPEKYWKEAARDLPVMVDDEKAGRLIVDGLKAGGVEGVFVVHKNTLGEMLCALLTGKNQEPSDMFQMSLPTYWTNDGASGWGGDRFYLLASGTNQSAAEKGLAQQRGVWITYWDRPEDRDEFVSDLESFTPDPARATLRVGRRAAAFFYNVPEAARAAIQAGLGKADIARQGGKAWKD